MAISKKTLIRSSWVALFMTLEAMVFQVSKNRLILHAGPPALPHLIAVTLCYLATGFAYSIGFSLVADRLPGRGWIGRGLRYAVMVLLVVWLSGLVAMLGLDFEGGWDMRSPAKVGYYWMGLCDSLNFMIGGLALGLIHKKEGRGLPAPRPLPADLGTRVVAGALLLPALCLGFFYPATLALPTGFELSGERAKLFYFFIFAPLAISGGGTALFHEALRSGERRSVAAESSRIFLEIFVLYWLTSNAFIPFLGFTWQTLIDFLVAGAAALFLTILALETIARDRWTARQRETAS